MSVYYRPVAQIDAARPKDALPLAGGWSWFNTAERLERGRPGELVPAAEMPSDLIERLTAARAPIAGLAMDRPKLMAILNATPDSFSDGGVHHGADKAIAGAQRLIAEGADILDIGGESTRPGAEDVPVGQECARVLPVIEALRAAGDTTPISIDTRKAEVARQALAAGAALVNDVTAFDHDPQMGPLVAEAGVPVCLMHTRGDPKTMQNDPRYDDVLLDIYDHLATRVTTAEALGISRAKIVVDPGIGFGKTMAHNLALIQGLSLFHGIGCAVLLGVSRKKFIGTIGGAEVAENRAPGSITLGLAALDQGIQLLRVHDLWQTRQAVALWQATRLSL
jgi:dihydropteroate synthase